MHKKFKCELHSECVAYTYERYQLICILHSNTDKGQIYSHGKQTGVKKTDYILSLPEISHCSNKNQQRRCRRQPKCNHEDCFRNAQDFCWLESLHSELWEMACSCQYSYSFWHLSLLSREMYISHIINRENVQNRKISS